MKNLVGQLDLRVRILVADTVKPRHHDTWFGQKEHRPRGRLFGKDDTSRNRFHRQLEMRELLPRYLARRVFSRMFAVIDVTSYPIYFRSVGGTVEEVLNLPKAQAG